MRKTRWIIILIALIVVVLTATFGLFGAYAVVAYETYEAIIEMNYGALIFLVPGWGFMTGLIMLGVGALIGKCLCN